jgi:hypothetical protein
MKELIWYWRGRDGLLNFGEHFVELMLPKLGVEFAMFDRELEENRIDRYNRCGMIIGSVMERTVVERVLTHIQSLWVWGTGNGKGPELALDLKKYGDRITIHALRGPITKRELGLTTEIPLCDSGFLMPRFFPLESDKTGDYLYVPHWENRVSVEQRIKVLGVDKFIDVLIPRVRILKVMEEIAKAKFVLTNAMHCFIFCLAFRVPCAVSLLPEEKLNMPHKWRDLFESMNAIKHFHTVTDLGDGIMWWETVGKHMQLPNSSALLKAFPLKEEYLI